MHPLLWLESRMMFGIKVGLEQILAILEKVGNPQKQLRCLHVVGTNGKGSTSYWSQHLLRAHGLRVGLFTSPHLVSVRERIRLDDEAISQQEFELWLSRVQNSTEGMEATYFEVLTAVALAWFAERKVDAVVLEAGLGGRLDSTNVVHAPVVVLTSIGFDHTEILGNSEAQILHEKLGVVHSGVKLIHAIHNPQLRSQIAEFTLKHQVECIEPNENIQVAIPHQGLVYQENARLAVTAVQAFLGSQFDNRHLATALRNAVWTGRQQVLRKSGSSEIWLDGCHNGHAALRLAETLQAQNARDFVLVLAVLSTKNTQEILEPLLPFVSQVILTRTPHPKMREPSEYASLISGVPVICEPHVEKALAMASAQQKPILCTGSLYFVGALVHQLCHEYAELAWYRQFTPSDNEWK